MGRYQGGIIFSSLSVALGSSGVQRPEINGTAIWQQIKPWCHPFASVWRQGSSVEETLTHPAGADVLNARLEARTEAFIGWVDGPIGKQSLGGREAIDGDAFKHP